MKGSSAHRPAVVVAVSASPTHSFSKPNVDGIRLLVGMGVDGDAHHGATVKHRSRVARDPTQPNLRQVHLMHEELFKTLAHQGFDLTPGSMGENVTTRGIDLLGLPTGTKLYLGDTATLEVTGLRNPCGQLNGLQPGLMDATRAQDASGNIVRLAGIMAIVLAGGEIRPGDEIRSELPAVPHHALQPV
jgi:MOSC domain-containing protein YiiM